MQVINVGAKDGTIVFMVVRQTRAICILLPYPQEGAPDFGLTQDGPVDYLRPCDGTETVHNTPQAMACWPGPYFEEFIQANPDCAGVRRVEVFFRGVPSRWRELKSSRVLTASQASRSLQ